MSDRDYFHVTVERKTKKRSANRWSYYSSSRTTAVTVLDDIPAELPLKNILWEDLDSNHHLNISTGWANPTPAEALEERGYYTFEDLKTAVEEDPNLLDNLVDDVPGFGDVTKLYLEASLENVDPDMEYFEDADWPFTISVPLPRWFREDILPFLEENMDENEIQFSVRKAAFNVLQGRLKKELSNSVSSVIKSSVEKRRRELERELERMEEVVASIK